MRICFVSHFALGALVPSVAGHIGGVERQTALMANWLARKGHDVSVITWAPEHPYFYEGPVRIIEICRESDGLRGIRFFHPRWSSLLSALRKADCEIYYQNCAEYVTGQVALWCSLNKRKFVYSVASNPECEASLTILGTFRERVLFKFGLRTADLIITQTDDQKKALFDAHGLHAVTLPMPGSASCNERGRAISAKDRSEPLRVIWVGRISPEKRPEILAQIAGELPEVAFTVIGDGQRDGAFSADVVRHFEGFENIDYVGRVEFDQIDTYYERGDVLLCTSSFEGFPNTFLEAWSHGMPVVSTVDCDGLINRHSLGFSSEKPADLVEHIYRLSNDPSLLREQAENAAEFYSNRHETNVAIHRFERALNDVRES